MLNVFPVPAFKDNYFWVIDDGRFALVVDPGDATPVIAYLAQKSLTLAAILITHHHADHVGGIGGLLDWCVDRNVVVYGPASENIPHCTHKLDDGATVNIISPALSLQVIDVPGHTAGHMAYHAESQGWLFCGDTLFAGGCGRLFEGTAAQMRASLGKLAALPAETNVFCAHEYTLANLLFACAVEPNNAALRSRVLALRLHTVTPLRRNQPHALDTLHRFEHIDATSHSPPTVADGVEETQPPLPFFAGNRRNVTSQTTTCGFEAEQLQPVLHPHQ